MHDDEWQAAAAEAVDRIPLSALAGGWIICNEPEPLVINELWILLLPGFLSLQVMDPDALNSACHGGQS